jgi:hypothetical protein
MNRSMKFALGTLVSAALTLSTLPGYASSDGHTVTGTVRGVNNTPLANVDVQLFTVTGGCSKVTEECVSATIGVKTNSSGNFTIANVNNGTYTLAVHSLPTQYPAMVFYPGVGSSSSATIVTVSDANVSDLVTVIPLAGSFTGSVPNAAPGGKARAENLDGSWTSAWEVDTNSSGNFTITRLFPDTDYLIYGTSSGSWSQYIGSTGNRVDASRYRVSQASTADIGRLDFKSPGTVNGSVSADRYGSNVKTTLYIYDQNKKYLDTREFNHYFQRLDYSLRLFTGTYYFVFSRGDGDDQGLGGFNSSLGEPISVVNGQTAYAPQAFFPLGNQIRALEVSQSGEHYPGSTLTLTPGVLDQGATVSYKWVLDGKFIQGQNSSSLLITAEMLGSQVQASVTSSKAGTRNQSISTLPVTITQAVFDQTPAPTISGRLSVGERLTADPGQWELGTTLSYSWFRGTSKISGETGSTYDLTELDLGAEVSVKVTATKLGYRTTTTQSEQVRVVEGTLLSPDESTIEIEVAVGKTLTLESGEWEDGVSLSYQWLRNGQAIAGATSDSYTLTGDDFEQQISVSVTGSKSGYTSVTVITASVLGSAGSLTLTPTPQISGNLSVGETVSVRTGEWDAGVTFQYQWIRDEQTIAGATSSTYTLTSADFDSYIYVMVTGSKAGSEPSSQVSNGYLVVEGNYSNSPEVAISGSGRVGETLTAQEGNWQGSPSFTYSWLRDGSPIVGANSKDYLVTSTDLDKNIAVRITTRIRGFVPLVSTSSNTRASLGQLDSLPTPAISGDKKVGSVLSASVGSWDPSGNVEYIWMRNGFAIVGATLQSYTLTAADLNSTVTVGVKGIKSGYQTVSATSAGHSIAAGTLTVISNPILQVPAAVGKILGADAGTWTPGTTLTYQWYLDGALISGATSKNYTLKAGDLGKRVSYSVTGRKNAYENRTITSQPVLVKEGQLVGSNPTITGRASLGSTLTANPGKWEAGTKIAYQWLTNGKPIAKANSKTYKISRSNLRATLTVRITATKPGYSKVTLVNRNGLTVK